MHGISGNQLDSIGRNQPGERGRVHRVWSLCDFRFAKLSGQVDGRTTWFELGNGSDRAIHRGCGKGKTRRTSLALVVPCTLLESPMKITRLQTFLANAGLRNYLFLKLHTDKGITGIGEATLEWQEETVRTLIHEFLEERYVLGANPFDVEKLISQMTRDQYQGGSTIMTAISGI